MKKVTVTGDVLLRAGLATSDVQTELPAIEEALERMKLRSNLWGMSFRIETAVQELTCTRHYMKILPGEKYCVFDSMNICLSCLALMLWAAGAHKEPPIDAMLRFGPLPMDQIPEPELSAGPDRYFSPAQVQDIFNWSSVRSVSTRARKLNWRRVRVSGSNSFAYNADDVLAYRAHIVRRLLVKRMGYPAKQVKDAKCPTCGGFAITTISGQSTLCEKGHKKLE